MSPRPATPALGHGVRVASPDELFREVARTVFARSGFADAHAWAQRHAWYYKDAMAYKWDAETQIPYAAGILQALARPGLRRLTIMAAEQMAKTEIAFKILGYLVTERPGRGLIVYPNKAIARRQNLEKLLPTFRSTPAIATLMKPGKGAYTGQSIHFRHMTITYASAPVNRTIDANVEAFDYGWVWIDELDRCHPDVLSIVEGRGKTRRDFLLICTSTPTYAGVGIDREYFGAEHYAGSDQGRYLVPCPHESCRRYGERDFGLVRWPGATKKDPRTDASRDQSADPEMVEMLAWARCPHCRQRQGREHNLRQLQRGRWIVRGQTIEPWGGTWERFRPGVVVGPAATGPHAGFHLPGLLSCIPAGVNPYGYVAKGFVAAKGRPDRHWLNRRHGSAYAEKAQTVEVREVQQRAIPAGQNGSYAKGTVPPGALVLTAAVDVQSDHAYIEVVAWHAFARKRSVVWWGVAPYTPSSPGEAINAAIAQAFPTLSGKKPSEVVLARIVDSGDRTDEVYDLIRRWRLQGKLAFAAKGVGLRGGAESMSRAVEVTKIDKRADGTNDPVGLELLRFNSFFFKSAAVRAMRGASVSTTTGDRKAWSDPAEEATEAEKTLDVLGAAAEGMGMTSELALPHDVDTRYLSQITAEHLVHAGTASQRRLVWQVKPGREGNHYFDCHVMNLALGERLGLRSLAPAGQVDPMLGPAAGAPPGTAQAASGSDADPSNVQAKHNSPDFGKKTSPRPSEVIKKPENPRFREAMERARAYRRERAEPE